MTNQWYFSRNGEKFGPFSVVQLKEMAAARRIEGGDTVWKDGMIAGVLAAKVKHLFADAAPRPPPTALTSALAAEEADPPPVPSPGTQTALEARLARPEGLELAPGEDAPWAPAAQEETEEAAEAREETRPPPKPVPPPAPNKPKDRRVLSVKGGVLASQDGQVVKFRKKCLRCGYADTSMTTMPIRPGTTRIGFYCPKCKKSQQVEVQGVG